MSENPVSSTLLQNSDLLYMGNGVFFDIKEKIEYICSREHLEFIINPDIGETHRYLLNDANLRSIFDVFMSQRINSSYQEKFEDIE